MLKPITKLPPAPDRRELHWPQYLKREALPVEAWYAGPVRGWETTGIAFEQLTSIHTVSAPLASHRKAKTPEWATNNDLLGEVILRYVERQAFGGKGFKTEGTRQERLEAALKALAAQRERKTEILSRLCREYVEMKNAACDARILHGRETAIEAADTNLRMLEQGHLLAIGCAYHYYRCGLTSVEVAEQLHIKPPHVRGVIWRLNKIGERLASGYEPQVRVQRMPRPKLSKPRKRPRHKYLLTIDTAVVVERYLNTTMSIRAIARSVGFPPNAGANRIRRLLSKSGVPKRQPKNNKTVAEATALLQPAIN